MIIYTSPNCPKCDELKAVLSAQDKIYEVINVRANPDAFDELIRHGFRSIPQVKIEGKFLSQSEIEEFLI